MLLIDATHTSHSCLLGGVQQVTRKLWRELPLLTEADLVVHDPFARRWRAADGFERRVMNAEPATLARFSGSRKYLMTERIIGGARRLHLLPSPDPFAGPAALLCPEVMLGDQSRRLRQARKAVKGPCAAIFHDAIVMRMPDTAPEKTLTGFPAYLETLLQFDGIAAVSEASRNDLLAWWEWLGCTDHPPVEVIPPGIDLPEASEQEIAVGGEPVILCVCTIEGRKNHLALLEAAEFLWAQGHTFQLVLVGTAVRGSSERVLEEIRELQARNRPVFYAGRVGPEELIRYYRQATFTVYPSLYEGFGLPVLESLSYGKPCVTSAGGGLAEVTREGGCLVVDPPDAAGLAKAIRRALVEDNVLQQLKREAEARAFRSWSTYARDIRSWIDSLR